MIKAKREKSLFLFEIGFTSCQRITYIVEIAVIWLGWIAYRPERVDEMTYKLEVVGFDEKHIDVQAHWVQIGSDVFGRLGRRDKFLSACLYELC